MEVNRLNSVQKVYVPRVCNKVYLLIKLFMIQGYAIKSTCCKVKILYLSKHSNLVILKVSLCSCFLYGRFA